MEPITLLLLVTYLRGDIELVTHEGERFRMSLEDFRKVVVFFDLMLSWTSGPTRSVDVGPYHMTLSGVGAPALPMRAANDAKPQHYPVNVTWLVHVRPLFVGALKVLDDPEIQPVADFSAVFDEAGNVVILPPDRTTLRPS